MRTQSRDTHPDAERVQIDLLRRATVATRIARVRSLTATTIAMSRRAVRRRHPELDERELDIAVVALHSGEELAQRLRRYLEARP